MNFKSAKKMHKLLSMRKQLEMSSKKVVELTAKLKRTEFEEKLLREINNALTATFELSEILSLILQVLTAVVNTQGVSIILVDQSDNSLQIAETHGLDDIEIAELNHKHKETNNFYAELYQNKQPVFYTASENSVIPFLLTVPLISQDKIIGFLNIHSMYKNKMLTPEKLDIIYSLASQASIAINNARLFLALKEQAFIDHCTGLFNFRYFHEKMDLEMKKADQKNEPLSVAILDIDFFKSINDTWGHLYGDTVLHELANLIKKNVRPEDTVCRYGGEEFAIIFPGCDLTLTSNICKRICENINMTTANDNRGVFKNTITVSIGIAGFVKDIHKTELVRQADSALYQAKNNGRNRVIIHENDCGIEIYQQGTTC